MEIGLGQGKQTIETNAAKDVGIKVRVNWKVKCLTQGTKSQQTIWKGVEHLGS